MLTTVHAHHKIKTAETSLFCRSLPPRSMVGQLTLDQHIGVRIPGGQPITFSSFHSFPIYPPLVIPLRSIHLSDHG